MHAELKNQNVLVSGATGLIGQNLVRTLQEKEANVFAVVRNKEKAQRILGEDIQYIISDITDVPLIDIHLNYIVHAAANTTSKDFVDVPVDVITTNFLGTLQMLKLAQINHVNKFVYLSTMEVYGAPATDEKIDELHSTNLNVMDVRTSYPESKRLCECLCVSFTKQYDVPTNVLRLTQTFGEGVKYDDKRVFAEFARCAIEGKDILLHTKGETKRSYLYVGDAVQAILQVLLQGKPGEAYNVANEDTYCSIYEMAELVTKCSNHPIMVKIEGDKDIERFGYAPVLKMNLDMGKIRQLGWKPQVGLQEMFERLIQDMKDKGKFHE